ncbi:hypothetical protein BSKO_13528 [Bryopsis sp. KO-2023]|nr:hypothetical protein BSKO_13528 [Bryopsis sp. KO-2023]
MASFCPLSTGATATPVSLGGGLRLPPRYRPDAGRTLRKSRMHQVHATPIDADAHEEGYEVVAQVGEASSSADATATSRTFSIPSLPPMSSIPPSVRIGAIGASAVGVLVVLAAGIRSMWVHRKDEVVLTRMKKEREELAAKLEDAKAEHSEQMEKREWEFAQKVKARDSETRAREREIRESLQEEHLTDLGRRLKSKEKEVSDYLNAKRVAEVEKTEAKWRARLSAKQDELATQKAAINEFKQQLMEMKEYQRGFSRREKDFENKVQKYDNAMSAVAPGGTVDTLKEKIARLEKEAKERERQLKKWRPASEPIIPAAKPAESEIPLNLSLISAGTIIPHQDKGDKGGEDAYFITRKGHGAMAVADGVGAWSEDGVDPAQYPEEFMTAVGQKIERLNGRISGTLEILRYAYERVKIPGSATTIIATLKPDGELEMANVGDCGLRVIRDGNCVFATKPHVHEFNMPYQLGCETHLEDTDHPSDAEIYHFRVKEGDVVVMGSDGLFDNVWDEDLAAVVKEELNGNSTGVVAKALSEKIAEVAFGNARSATVKTPWSVEEAAASGNFFSKLFPKGGKMDDCTVLVGLVKS